MKRKLTILLFILYSGMLTYQVLFKAVHSSSGTLLQYVTRTRENVPFFLKQVQVIPFQTIIQYGQQQSDLPLRIALWNMGGNIIGFIPLTFFVCCLIPKYRSAMKSIFLAFSVSLCYEMTQWYFMLGAADIDDLMLNTLGGYLGYLSFTLVKRLRMIR